MGFRGAFGHWLLVLAHARAPATILAPFIDGHIIWMLALGPIMFGGRPASWTFVGAGIVIASGLYWFSREHAKQTQPETPFMNDAPVENLPGIGSVTQNWLREVGIRTEGELRSMGAVEAYRRLKFMLPRRVNLNALYALEAALRGCHWLDLPQDVKAALQDQAKAIDEILRRGAAARCTIP